MGSERHSKIPLPSYPSLGFRISEVVQLAWHLGPDTPASTTLLVLFNLAALVMLASVPATAQQPSEVSPSGLALSPPAATLDAGPSTAAASSASKFNPVTVSIDVVASRHDIAAAQLYFETQQRVAGIVPNFFVSYDWNALPLTPRQKFSLALKNATDPGNLFLVGTVAGVQQATNAFNGYGQGARGYGRRYGADLGNLVSGTFVSGAILPTLFHQDPRYFYKGTGSVRSRLLYALSSAVICRGDNGRRQPAFSTILGDMSAGAISNLYYAPSDRKGAGLTVTNGLLGISGDAMNDIFQEFFLRKLTRHPIPGSSGQAP